MDSPGQLQITKYILTDKDGIISNAAESEHVEV